MFKTKKPENPDVNIRLSELRKKDRNKRIFFTVAFIAVTLLTINTLISKGYISRKAYQNVKAKEYEEMYSAKNVFDLNKYIEKELYPTYCSGCGVKTNDPASVWYCETKDYKDIINTIYLLDHHEYVDLEYKGEKYIFFKYHCQPLINGGALFKVENINKNYINDTERTLSLTFDNDLIKGSTSYNAAACILKLDGDIDKLIVDGEELTRYQGGTHKINQKNVTLDENMQVISITD